MASAGLGVSADASARDGSVAPSSLPHDDGLSAAAWLSAIPCAIVVLVAAYLLGPPLGRLMTPAAGAYTFTPDFASAVRPEPTEHARFLIALSLPLLIAFATVTAPRWARPPPSSNARTLVTVVQGLLAALIVACYVTQVHLRFGRVYTQDQFVFRMRYFTTGTLLVGALLAAGALITLRQDRARRVASALLRESRTRRVAALLIAVAMTAIWLLPALQSDTTLANAPEDVRFHISFPLDETFAVLNGLTPLVDFSAQYGSLWPFVVALPMLAFGKTVLAFSAAMCVLTGLALLSLYGVLRRVVRSAMAALLLYLPFLATSVFLVGGRDLVDRTTVGTYNGTFPLRYAIPYFLAFLTARHIDREDGLRGTYLLFLVGGLGVLNNADFGVAAVGATVAALVCARTPGSRPPLRRLALTAGAGLLTALAIVCLLTLVRAGSLPHLSRLVDYARLFTLAGFAMMPVPGLLGMHLIIYVTYVAAIAVATVRVLRHEPDRVLTGMLVWVGIFGLGSAGYYVGRSHPVALKSLFSPWSLALALLAVVVVRDLAARPSRQVTIAAVAVLFGLGVTACSLAQAPLPWSQIERFGAPYTPREDSDNGPRPLVPSQDPSTRRFVAELADGPSHFVYKRGAPVLILLRTGHRVADAYGVRNVSPYTGMESTPTVQRIEAALDALAKAGGNTAILPNPLDPGIFPVLERRGFRLVTHHGLKLYNRRVPHSDAVMPLWPYDYVIKWVDTRHLHPRALREP
ncbi:MAG: hypothetical protein ACJ76L_02905 [Conexibacter sp.]